tara:strand:+ start:222 stop:515 length:294 start_codon:yes stop_codon:yes gene_type:complete
MTTTVTTILNKTVAFNSETITVAAGYTIQVYANASLSNNEYVGLEQSYNGSVWTAVRTAEGAGILDKNNSRAIIAGPITCRLNKGPTTASITVYYDS